MAGILVFGSINIDLVARVASIPKPGETVLAPSYATVCGGKGANQAVAAGRVSAPGSVAMVGCVGDDGFGQISRDNFAANGVDATHVAIGKEPTGAAFITVDARGENAITVGSGANMLVTARMAPDSLVGPGTILVLQMEVPFAASLEVARRVKAAGGRVLWNFAPAPPDFPAADLTALVEAADYIILNEHEAVDAAATLGRSGLEPEAAAAHVAAKGGTVAVLTAGAEGARAYAPDGSVQAAPALPIKPLDTTGAGDSFVGILAAQLAAGEAFQTALARACIGASLACLAEGAQIGMPTLDTLLQAERNGRA